MAMRFCKLERCCPRSLGDTVDLRLPAPPSKLLDNIMIPRQARGPDVSAPLAHSSAKFRVWVMNGACLFRPGEVEFLSPCRELAVSAKAERGAVAPCTPDAQTPKRPVPSGKYTGQYRQRFLRIRPDVSYAESRFPRARTRGRSVPTLSPIVLGLSFDPHVPRGRDVSWPGDVSGFVSHGSLTSSYTSMCLIFSHPILYPYRFSALHPMYPSCGW